MTEKPAAEFFNDVERLANGTWKPTLRARIRKLLSLPWRLWQRWRMRRYRPEVGSYIREIRKLAEQQRELGEE